MEIYRYRVRRGCPRSPVGGPTRTSPAPMSTKINKRQRRYLVLRAAGVGPKLAALLASERHHANARALAAHLTTPVPWDALRALSSARCWNERPS